MQSTAIILCMVTKARYLAMICEPEYQLMPNRVTIKIAKAVSN